MTTMLTVAGIFLLCVVLVSATVNTEGEGKTIEAPPEPRLFGATYDSTLAMVAWKYSKASYCAPTSIKAWNCNSCANYNPGMSDVLVYENAPTGAQAFVGYNKNTKTVVVSFRGSANIQNWINNLDFFYTPYPNKACNTTMGLGPNRIGCQVHRGFLNVYSSVKASVLSRTKALLGKYLGSKLLVTGHSLGGALALLAGVDCSLNFKDQATDIAVYTFGAPRVGNPIWAQWSSQKVIPGGKQYRVTHKADPVPRLPPIEFGFLHVPHEVWYNNDLAGNTFTSCPDSATSESMKSCENTQTAFGILDHLAYLGVLSGC